MRRITIKELKEKIEFLKQSITKEKIDLVFWLEEFSPNDRLSFPYDPNQKLSVEEHNKRSDEWQNYYKEHYLPLLQTMLNRIFDQIEVEGNELDNSVEISELLVLYCKFNKSKIRNRATHLMNSFDLTLVIPKILEGIAASDKEEVNEAIERLESLKVSNKWKEKGLLKFNDDLINALKSALSKEYDFYSRPYFRFFLLVNQLSQSIPEALSKLQEELIDLTDYEKLGYKDYESIMYMYERSWSHMKEYWDSENIERLQKKIYKRAKKEYKKGDHWVEQYVLTTLEIIGKGNDEAEKVIQWLKEQYNLK